MRRAIKEGRMMGTAPYGYINKCTEDGRKYVAIKEPEASNIIWAFKEVAKGHLPSVKVRELMNKREGRKLTRNSFLEALRNVVYCGNIILKAHGDEEEKIIKGKHEPLISEELFDDERKLLEENIAKIENKITKARDLYLEDKLDEEDFRAVKTKNKDELDRLLFKLNSIKQTKKNNNVEHRLYAALNAVTQISERYKKADTVDKGAIIGLIYPEKLTFDGENFQTAKSIVLLILSF